MHVGKLFDQALVQIEDGALATGLYGLSGALNLAQNDTNEWPAMRAALHDHDLHNLLLEDPYINRARLKPRGYAGDAKLIDFIYDRNPPQKTGQRGRDIFEVTTAFPVSESVRFRRDLMADKLDDAWRAGKRICSLACGHFREGDNLIGEDLSNITLVDQDDLSLATIEGRHGANVRIVQGNVFQFLRSAK